MITCKDHPQSDNTCRKCQQQAKVSQFTRVYGSGPTTLGKVLQVKSKVEDKAA